MKTSRTAFLLVVISVLTKPINFAKEVVAAALFGAGSARDAFVVASQVPAVVGSLVVDSLPQFFVAFITDIRRQGDPRAALRTIITLVGVFLLLLSIVVLAFAPFWIRLTAPFLDLETHELAVSLLRIVALSVLFMGSSAVLTGLLYSIDRFVVPAFAVPLSSTVVIVTMVVGAERHGISALAYGVLAGSFATVALQVSALFKERYRPRLVFNDDVRRFLRLVSRFVLGTIVFGVGAIVEKVFASSLDSGSISHLDYAARITGLSFTSLAPITIAIFPTLTRFALDPDRQDEFAQLVAKGLHVLLFVSAPIALVLFLLRVPVVEALYERGAFSHESSLATASLLGIYAFGVVPHALNHLLIHVFYARQAFGMRVRSSLLVVGVMIATNLGLIRLLQAQSLAVANSLAATVCLFYLGRHVARTTTLDRGQITRSALRIVANSIAASLAARLTYELVTAGLGLVAGLCTSLVAGAFVYIVAAAVARAPELRYARDLIPRGLRRRQS